MTSATHIAPPSCSGLAQAERIISEIVARRSTPIQAWVRGDSDSGAFAGGLTYHSAQQQSSWIYACIAAISEEIANLPFRFSIGERHGDQIVEQGDFVTLFEQPHPYLNKFEFWEHIVGWLLLRGKCFIIGYDKAGNVIRWRNRLPALAARPVQLYLLNPDRMQKQCYQGQLAYWKYYTGQDEPVNNMQLEPDEVLWLRLPLIGDFYEGLSPLSVALLTARGDHATAQFIRGYMENNADQGLVASTDQKLSAEQRTQIEAAVRNRKRRAGRADVPLILEGGLKVEKPEMSLVDMAVLELRKFSRQEICAIFRVSQEIIGFTEDANRSVSLQMRLSFIQFRILPLAARLESFVDPVVKSFDPKLYGWFDDEAHPVMIGARRERWVGAIQAFSIGVPIDECSKQFDLGLPDNLPHKGKSYLPFSMQEVVERELPGDGLEEPGAEDGGQKPEDGTEAGKAVDRLLAKVGRSAEHCSARNAPQHAEQCSALRAAPGSDAYAASIAGSVKIKHGRLRKFFFEQRNRVLAALETEVGRAAPPTRSGPVRALENLLNVIEESRVLFQRLGPLLRNDLEFGVAQIGKELGIDDFKVAPEAAIDFLSRRQNMIKEINQTTFDALRDSLKEGLAGGETFEELTARVKDIYKEATDARAESVALTETNIAVNSGRFEGMKQAGVEKKGWQTSNLAGVRPEHLQAEIEYADGIPLDEPFIVGGEALRYPGDPNGSAGNVINCRCFTFAILGEKTRISRINANGDSPVRENSRNSREVRILTFEEWAGRNVPRSLQSDRNGPTPANPQLT